MCGVILANISIECTESNNARRVCVYVCLLDGFAVASASDDGCLLP